MTSFLRSFKALDTKRFLKKLIRKTAFLSTLLILLTPRIALTFDWPFNSKEFNNKLSAQELTPTVRFYARGPTFLPGQLWNELKFNQMLQLQGYRLRSAEQSLQPGDAVRLDTERCIGLRPPAAHALQISHCWQWRTKSGHTYLVQISADSIIALVQTGESRKPHWKASLEPQPLAQYRKSQPIMQNEVTLAEIPIHCLNAVMAIEDSEFLNHSGLSYVGLTRSLIKNIRQMRYAQGGSTITQQLVKNYFLTPEKTIKRKLTELYLATKLESEWTKNQILETYLNIIYMGQSGPLQVIGFAAAAQHYFNKNISDLSLPECSLLAAIVNNPGRHNPWQQKERASKRRELVLNKMQELNLISGAEASEARKTPLPTLPPPLPAETAPYFIDAARKQLETEMQTLSLERESLNVYTSLDLQAQSDAQQALQKHLKNLEKTKKNIALNRSRGLRLEGLILLGENQSGLLTAVVGGQSYRLTQYNRALNSKRQVGSLIKPFIYLTALSQNIIEPETEVHDSAFTWSYGNQSWTPLNYDKKFRGPVPAYYALKESLNVAAARLAQQSGLENIIKTAHSAGLRSEIEPFPASSLGTSHHYPQEVFDAYRTLASGGQQLKSGFIEKIESADGKSVYYEHTPVSSRSLPEVESAQTVFMMKQALLNGTAQSAAKLGWSRHAAGKTGTTSNNKDAWFAGFTPHETAVVWLGYDQPQTSELTGASGALPVWVALMRSSSEKWPDNEFSMPENTELRETTLFDTDKKIYLLYKK